MAYVFFRNKGTTLRGGSFTRSEIDAVWQKAKLILGYDPAEWRYNICGNPIRYQDYGDTSSQYGWEIDHIQPVSKHGSDHISNLQPLAWENNRRKGDSYPWYG